MSDFAEFCIYTIAGKDRLTAASRAGAETTIREAKPWVTGMKLWRQARDSGRVLPVLLGDAADCSKLLFWGTLSDLQVNEEGTRYTIAKVRSLARGRTPQDLILRNTGRRIAANFIRPYAICRTPAFLK